MNGIRHTLEELPGFIRNNSVWVPFCGCWIWMFSLSGKYGQLIALGENYAHHVSYIVFKGPITKGFHVCHTCNTPPCVNPDHLYLDTQQGNMQYAIRCQRHVSLTHPEKLPRGNEHWTQKYPEKIAKGERSGARVHPEKVARGERQGSARLTESQVREIRSLYATGIWSKIALVRKFNSNSVADIISGKSWRHVV